MSSPPFRLWKIMFLVSSGLVYLIGVSMQESSPIKDESISLTKMGYGKRLFNDATIIPLLVILAFLKLGNSFPLATGGLV